MPLTFGTLFHADLAVTVGCRRGGDFAAAALVSRFDSETLLS